jgi:hypothetical protein
MERINLKQLVEAGLIPYNEPLGYLGIMPSLAPTRSKRQKKKLPSKLVVFSFAFSLNGCFRLATPIPQQLIIWNETWKPLPKTFSKFARLSF